MHFHRVSERVKDGARKSRGMAKLMYRDSHPSFISMGEIGRNWAGGGGVTKCVSSGTWLGQRFYVHRMDL